MIYACALFLVSFGWFATHAVPSVYFGDNGELLAAIHTGGLPHPTGFPLFLLYSTLPSHAGTFAVNLASASAGALAVVLTALLARRLFGLAAAFPAAACMLGSCTLLLQSSMARVYSLELAAMEAVMLAASAFQPTQGWGLLFGFLFGLSAGTHTLFLGGGLFTAFLLRGQYRRFASSAPWALGGFLLGLSIYLWVPLRAHLHPAVSWGDPSSFDRLRDYLLQRQYAEKMFARDGTGTWLFLKTLSHVFSVEWNPLVWILAAWGGREAWLLHPRKCGALGAVFFFNILLLYAYGNVDDLTLLYRYFLPTYACAAVLAGLGAASLWSRWGGAFREKPSLRYPAGVLFFFLLAYFPAVKWGDLSRSTATFRYVLNLFRPLPTGTRAVMGGDNQVFPVAFGRYVCGLRPDLRLVEWEGTLFPETARLLHAPGSQATPQSQELQWLREQGGFLMVPSMTRWGDDFRCRPYGLMYRLSDAKVDPTLPAPPAPYWLPPSFTRSETLDHEADEPRADLFLMAATWHTDRGDRSGALQNIQDAVNATPDTVRTLINAAAQLGEYNVDAPSEALLLHALEVQPGHFETLLNLGIHYGKLGRYDDCRVYLERAAARRPNDPIVLHYLAQLDAETRVRP